MNLTQQSRSATPPLCERPFWEFADYKELVLARLETMSGGTRGRFRRLAELLHVHPTMITHVFRDELHLTADQAVRVAFHLGFGELERSYLLHLVLHARAADPQSREYFASKLESLRERGRGHATSQDTRYLPLLAHWTRLVAALAPLRGPTDSPSREPASRLYRWLQRMAEDVRSPLGLLHQRAWRSCVSEHRFDSARGDLSCTIPLLLTPQAAERLRERTRTLLQEARSSAAQAPGSELLCLSVSLHEPALEAELRKDYGTLGETSPVSH